MQLEYLANFADRNTVFRKQLPSLSVPEQLILIERSHIEGHDEKTGCFHSPSIQSIPRRVAVIIWSSLASKAEGLRAAAACERAYADGLQLQPFHEPS